MTYELVLLSVVVAAGYWGQFFVRRRPHGTITFGAMQLGAAALAGLGLVARHLADPPRALEVAGAIGVGAGTCLLFVGPLVRGLARRLAASEHSRIAARLFDLADLLAPGSGVADEKALLGAMREIREGRIEPTVDALTAAKDRAPADARLAIDERIAMLYLAAYRWDDAIAHAEAHLFESQAPADGTLRGALGLAPPVWVELLGAYGRTGDLDRAARMLAKLEDACAGRTDAAVWLHRARLMFLALAGRTDAVRALVAPRSARHMSAAARTYWVAVAHEHRGERAAAIAAYGKARTRSRGRPRALIDEALARMPAADGTAPLLGPVATEVVARVESSPLPVSPPQADARGPWATRGATVAIVAVALFVRLAVGETGDVGVLVRAGAMVRGLVAQGEWWRLLACIFLHVGALHLAVNTLGMWFIGRIAEELFGSVRTLAIFGAAGVAGSVASYLASPAGLSAGASGAVFGVLGALFVELTWHRKRYRAAWKRGMWGGIAVVTVAQLASDFVYPISDQWAHGAGLAMGGLVGLALSPHAKWAKAGLWAARAVAVAFVAAAIAAAALAARTTLPDSLANGAVARTRIGPLAITAPATWHRTVDGVAAPDDLVSVRLDLQLLTNAPAQIATWVGAESQKVRGEQASDAGDDEDAAWTVASAKERLVALPAGWDGAEVDAAFTDGLGYRQHLRVIAVGKPFGGEVVFVRVVAPESIVRALHEAIERLIGAAGPA